MPVFSWVSSVLPSMQLAHIILGDVSSPSNCVLFYLFLISALPSQHKGQHEVLDCRRRVCLSFLFCHFRAPARSLRRFYAFLSSSAFDRHFLRPFYLGLSIPIRRHPYALHVAALVSSMAAAPPTKRIIQCLSILCNATGGRCLQSTIIYYLYPLLNYCLDCLGSRVRGSSVLTEFSICQKDYETHIWGFRRSNFCRSNSPRLNEKCLLRPVRGEASSPGSRWRTGSSSAAVTQMHLQWPSNPPFRLLWWCSCGAHENGQRVANVFLIHSYDLSQTFDVQHPGFLAFIFYLHYHRNAHL